MQPDKRNKFNLTETLLAFSPEELNETIIHYKNERWSRYDLQRKVAVTASFLKNKNIYPDERVLLLMYDSPAFIVCFLALISIGSIPVPVNPKIKSDGLKFILEDSRASGVIVEYEEKESIIETIEDSLFIERQKIIINDTDRDVLGLKHYISLKEGYNFDSINSRYYLKNPDSVAFWQYTSGTSGNPKAVMHSQISMLDNTENFAKESLNISSNDKIYSVSKMFFGYGLGNSLFFPILLEAEVFLDSDWPSIDKIVKNIKSYKPTILFAVPKIYLALLDINDEELTQILGQIRILFSAGSHLTKEINTNWKLKYGNFILDGIGATELGHVFISNNPSCPIPGATGFPVKGYKVKLVDENNNEVPPGSKGQLCIKPRYPLLGYWENEAKNREKFSNGWYYTGDLFIQDEQESYTFLGRSDDLFKVNGRWIVPAEIENIILSNFPIEECALVGSMDRDGNTIPVLFLSKISKEEISINSIYESLKDLDSYKRPEVCIEIESFPKNDNGKTLRRELLDIAKLKLENII